MSTMRRVLLCAAIFVLAVATAAEVRAQSLEDSLESELDQLELQGVPSGNGATLNGAAAKPAAKPQPAPMGEAPDSDFSDLEPLADPFGAPTKTEPVVPPATAEAPSDEAPVAAPVEKPRKPSKPKPAKVAKAKRPRPAPVDQLAPASDEPNERFESRLAQIYSDTSEPVSDEKWTSMLGLRASESYSVATGDTLWDLSQTFFADGFYWSKLWAENPEIQNPHRIEKGQALRFAGGTEAAAPEVRVVKDDADTLTEQAEVAFEKVDVVAPVQEIAPEQIEIDVALPTIGRKPEQKSALNQAPYYQEDIEGKITQSEIDAGVVIEQSEIVPKPPMPPPSTVSRPVLRRIPRSFAEYVPKIYDKSVTIQRRRQDAERIPGAVVPPQFGVEQLPDPMGVVEEIESGDTFASIGQAVFIKANEPLAIGAKYQALTPLHSISSRVSGRIGTAVELGGVLQITEKVDDVDGIYRAVVVFAVAPITLKSIILAGEPPRIPVTTRGRRNPGEAIVVSGGSEERQYFGDDAVVFLDTLRSEARVGDVFAVQSYRGGRRDTIAPEQRRPIAILKVFAVSGKLASAIVVLTTEEIRVGDRTGPEFPRRLPDLRIEPPRLTRAASQ